MKSLPNKLATQGYLIIDHVIDQGDLKLIDAHCQLEQLHKVGTRNMLSNDWVKILGNKLRLNPKIKQLLEKNAVLAQCTYFTKNTADNWSVTLHRDLGIPVAQKIDSEHWAGWSTKEGTIYGQPPREVLDSLLVVRVHLEDNDLTNGAFHVVPGSHIAGNTKAEKIVCEVKKGGALIMRPLILHKSQKLQLGTRRVLHFIFGPQYLPNGAEWPASAI
jgi:hypothetical protein